MGMKNWRIWMDNTRLPVSGRIEMTRAEFTNVVMTAFGNATPEMQATLKDWCQNEAHHVAWGKFFGKTGSGLECDCPIASVSEHVTPEYEVGDLSRKIIVGYDHTVDGAAVTGGGIGRYDTAMSHRTGSYDGLVTIVD